MALPIFPNGVKSLGNLAVGWAPSIAGANGPTVAEITVTVSCDIVGPQGGKGEQNVGNAPLRLCSKTTEQRMGRFSPQVPDLKYLVNPQTPTDVNYKAYLTLTEGLNGFLIFRYGLDAQAVDWVAAQKVDVYPVELGARIKDDIDPSEEFGLITVMQKVAVTGQRRENVAIA